MSDLEPNLSDFVSPFDVDLTAAERRLLVEGLVEWGGRCTDNVARVMGFAGLADFRAGRKRIIGLLENEAPLSGADWFRALAATELVFASEIYGAGSDWEIVTGFSDEESVKLLRRVQTKLVGVIPRPRFELWPDS